MLRTHRARLALVAAAATGVLLGVVFIAVVVAARRYELSQRQTELVSALNAVTDDDRHLEIGEFRESHPEMSLTLFDRSGRSRLSVGALILPRHLGFHQGAGVLSLGRRRGGATVVVGSDWRPAEEGIARLGLLLGVLWLPLTVLCGAVTWFAADAVFRPLAKLSLQAAQMGRSSLSERLETEDQAEFGAFAAQLNRMLDRVEESVAREERFASDAAHELRTPLAILRVRLESTLLKRRSIAEYVEAQNDALAELERLSRVVESLLQTTQPIHADSASSEIEDVVAKAAARWQDRAITAGVRIKADTAAATVAIGEDELAVVLDNLLANALRFSPPGGTISVWSRLSGTSVEVGVGDEGPGIDAELGERVFDRFVRADDDRNRASGGAGIGLSVCRRIVEARGGGIEIRPSGGHGTLIVFTAPVVTAAGAPD